jgi:hypothetical protein
MTGLYYADMVDVLQAAGCEVAVTAINDGWQTRARSSGGFPSAPLGVVWHHTASSTTPANDLAYMIDGSDDAPIGNLYIDRDGVCWPVAAGASNCAGKGGPVFFSRGMCPLDAGNTRCFNIEVANSGVGERWPVAQVDAFFAASNALNAHVGNQPYDIVTHALGSGDGYTDRKIDPATADAVEGPWQPASTNSSGTWRLADIVAECVRRAEPLPPPGDEEDMLRKVVIPKVQGDPGWWPWLALFDSGVIRPLANGDQSPADGQTELTDVAQYRRLCHWANIQLEQEQP